MTQPLPKESRHRFYPTDKIMSNHLYNANKNNALVDQHQSLIKLVGNLKLQNLFILIRDILLSQMFHFQMRDIFQLCELGSKKLNT